MILNESKKIFTIANTVSDRLEKFNDIESEVLFPPSPLANKIFAGNYENYIICVARLNTMKRQHLLIEAAKYMSSDIKVKIVGKGESEYEKSLLTLIKQNKLEDRVQLLGFVEEEEILDLLGNFLDHFNTLLCCAP